MDVKVAFAVVCLCALVIASTEAALPRCCIRTKDHIPNSIMRKVYKAKRQRSDGICDIEAIVLYVNGMKKPICANPKLINKWIQMDKRKA